MKEQEKELMGVTKLGSPTNMLESGSPPTHLSAYVAEAD